MKIVVNGESREYKSGITLQLLIEDLKITDKVMASAINTQIVKKDEWDQTILKDKDVVELLHFVGGG
jgi:sulfur carrier protein